MCFKFFYFLVSKVLKNILFFIYFKLIFLILFLIILIKTSKGGTHMTQQAKVYTTAFKFEFGAF